jgi:hypothetical protein
MAFNSIPQTWITSGKFVIQSLMQYIKDNFDAIYASVFGISNSDVPNGSFEIDSDSDGIPDNWTQNLYPGGSASIDSTTQASASKSWKFTSPGGSGNGGGYGDSDYGPCSELSVVNLRFYHKSSVAGIHNQVILRWYTAAKVYISSTTIYDDAAANPTSWTQFIRGAMPVATARYFKARLVGANSDNATAGSAWFDNVGLVPGVDSIVGYAENTGSTSDTADRVYIATALSSPIATSTMNISGVKKGVSGGGNVVVDLRNSSGSVLTVTLALPLGSWTIFASADWLNGDTASVPFEGNLTAMAIREG